MHAVDAMSVPGATGKAPDLPAGPASAGSLPLDLPRLVMRRALVVAVTFLLLSLVLGWVAARSDTREEIAGALSLARMEQRLRDLPANDGAALASLHDIGALRHVQLRVTDADGRVVYGADAPSHGSTRSTLFGTPAVSGQTVSWPIRRPDGSFWSATLTASGESEEREALTNLMGLFGLLAACSLLMLAVMRWNVRQAFDPLQAMLAAIAGIERQDLGGVKALPPMPIRELEATSIALKRLASSLEQAEDARRLLAHKILTLQEDERQRIARDLHDEFGQRLTALRVDCAWLGKRVADDAAARHVVAGMSEQVAHIQQDVREMLTRLQPLAAGEEGTETAARLIALLETLATSWTRSNAGALRCEARVTHGAPGRAGQPSRAEDRLLPRAVVLALYRISQEAFTNAARHGHAQHAAVAVDIADGPAGSVVLDWSASDDGDGLTQADTALQRGNGLAGIRERVWALGGEFDWSTDNPPPMRGLRLHARLACQLAEAAG
jgi:two-component system sensor histidine kinase UhpB